MAAPSKFFFSLERKNGQSPYFHSLRSENGQELTEPSDIRQRAVRFNAGLYTQFRDDDELCASFFEDLGSISEDSKAELERPLSERELYVSLQMIESGRGTWH